MKTETHPQYFPKAVIKCANCGTDHQTGATREDITVEICSQCHPFFTGKNVLIDAEGRVDRFRQKMGSAVAKKKKVRKKKTLEEKVNQEISELLKKEEEQEEKKAAAKKSPAAKAEKTEAKAPKKKKEEEFFPDAA